MFPGAIALDERAALDADGSMQTARDVLHFFDQAVVEEVLRGVADDQLRGVKLAHAWSRLGVGAPGLTRELWPRCAARGHDIQENDRGWRLAREVWRAGCMAG